MRQCFRCTIREVTVAKPFSKAVLNIDERVNEWGCLWQPQLSMGNVKLSRWICKQHKIPRHILLLWRYISDKFLPFSTISFHLERSCTCSAHFTSFIFFRPFLTSSSHWDLGFPAGLPVNGFHLCILFTLLVSGILFVSKPTQSFGFNIIYFIPVLN